MYTYNAATVLGTTLYSTHVGFFLAVLLWYFTHTLSQVFQKCANTQSVSYILVVGKEDCHVVELIFVLFIQNHKIWPKCFGWLKSNASWKGEYWQKNILFKNWGEFYVVNLSLFLSWLDDLIMVLWICGKKVF